MNTDVTVSVWNKYHSEQLIQGLSNNGLLVQANGNMKSSIYSYVYKKCIKARLLDILTRKLSLGNRVVNYSRHCYDQFSVRNLGDNSVFWGWSGHHLKTFEKCKELGKTVIVERGSSHPQWRVDRMSIEYKRARLPHSNLSKETIASELREIELADYVSIPSEFVAETFRMHGVSEEKLLINPYGADVEYWNKSRIERKDASRRPLTFVWTGGIILRKGVHYLIEAWKAANLENAKLVFVGAPAAEAREVLKNLPDNVELCGSKTHDELIEIYKNADVAVLPSLEEGMARSLLEAMAAGLPLIVTWETGVTQLMNESECGWVLEAMSVDAIVDALRQASRNRDGLSAMGENAYEAVKDYSWAAYGDRAAKILKGIL